MSIDDKRLVNNTTLYLIKLDSAPGGEVTTVTQTMTFSCNQPVVKRMNKLNHNRHLQEVIYTRKNMFSHQTSFERLKYFRW